MLSMSPPGELRGHDRPRSAEVLLLQHVAEVSPHGGVAPPPEVERGCLGGGRCGHGSRQQ
jgi:hypothetical protein